MRGNQGAGIATVLMVMAVLGTLALTLASTTTFHLRVATNQSSSEQSRNLVESVLALTIDRIADERDLGTGTTSATEDSVTVQFSPDQPTGRLTFDTAQATIWAIPVSVNNLENDAAVLLPDGRSLPPFSAYLVAQAEFGGVQRSVEQIVRIPVYKYALATSGTIVSSGGLLVASIKEDTDLSGGLSAIPDSELEPGHLAANGDADTILNSTSGSTTRITGDVVAGGTVTVGAHTDVDGSVKENHDPEELPDLEVTDYDPNGWVGLQSIGSSSVSGPDPLSPYVVEGVRRRSGDLQVNGDLELDGGYFYVDGNLTVNGQVAGKGSIFATGNVSISDASGFSADNVAAIVADGDLTISGGSSSSDKDNSFFTGILFSRGNVSLSNVTVVGSVINNSPTDTSLELNNVGLLLNPETLEFEFQMPIAGDYQDFPWGNSDYVYGIIPDSLDYGSFYSEDSDSFTTPNQTELGFNLYLVADVGSVYDDPELIRSFANIEDVEDFINEGGHHELLIEFPDDYNPSDSRTLWGDPIADVENPIKGDFDHTTLRGYLVWYINTVSNISDLYQESKQESLREGKLTFDPNQFIPFEDRIRVIWNQRL